MLEPIRLILEMYAFEPTDETTRQEVLHTLNQLYPEATWAVSISDHNVSYAGTRFIITPVFETPEQETFYRIKWA
jgi:hypothetical protein